MANDLQNSKPFRIAFIPTMNSGVVYYRMWAFAQALRKIPNVDVAFFCWQPEINNVHPWMQDCYTNRRVRVEIEDLVRCADVTVFGMVCTPMALSLVEAVKKITGKPILMEIDDYVYNIPRFNAGSEVYFPNSDLEHFALSQMKISDGMIVTTPFLKKVYSEYNKNIFEVPNSIDFNLWKPKPVKHAVLRIGWIGGGTHSEDLEMVWPALDKVLNKYECKFYCIHGVPNFLKDKQGVFHTHDWRFILEYPRFMASYEFDIGIAPLVDCSFNNAKTNLRWLEYSALKIPSVCSNIGHFADTVEHGKTGFKADTVGEWIEHLSALIEDKKLRQEMGKNAFESVKNSFEVNKTAGKYLEILKNFVKEGKYDSCRT